MMQFVLHFFFVTAVIMVLLYMVDFAHKIWSDK